jgi:hypothetical protein
MPVSEAIGALTRDLEAIFGARLRSLVAYAAADQEPGGLEPTLAVVDDLSPDDLRACADRVKTWHDAGLATPLLLGAPEFARSLDAFPFEFGAILGDHVVVRGADPFEGLRVNAEDFRRACEIQARSHLLHLREAYIETEGRSDALADLIARSAAPLAALLRNVERLKAAGPSDAVLARVARIHARNPLPADEARRIFPEYLRAVEHLTNAIDRWSGA